MQKLVATKMLKRAVLFALLIGLSMVTVVSAITITIDGNKDATWDGSGGQIPGIQPDLDEGGIDNRYDLREIRWTNDSTGGVAPYGNMYWLFETYGNFDYNFPSNEPLILVCLDVDNNVGTGTAVTGFCNDMSGVDRRIRIFPGMGSVQVQQWNGASFANVAMPPGGLRAVAYADAGADGVADTPFIEAGFDLQSLGITNSATCITGMRAAVYYDNGIADGEDNVSDAGTFSVSCGAPTAVTLANANAQSQTGYLVVLALVGVFGLGLLSFATVQKRR